MIRAVIFDFDGLILDTEMPAYEAWKEIFVENGLDLSVADYAAVMGSSEIDAGWYPVQHINAATGLALDPTMTAQAAERRRRALIDRQPVMPGVTAALSRAVDLGLLTAVASSSRREWVVGYLDRLDLSQYFTAVVTREDTARTKPAPDLFLAVLDALGAEPREAIVLEDSYNGVVASAAAGIFTVAVPNALTRDADFSRADLVIESLAATRLDELIHRAENGRR
jgi:HAD superfamily hydrolase (TIGR01509 family)